MNNNDDVRSIGGVINALYESISGFAGESRDHQRASALFHPTARLVRTGIGEDGKPFERAMTHTEYQQDTAAFFAGNDFFEVETDRSEWRFGNIAHVLSRYEARRSPNDPAPERRGVNSIQLFHDGDRWWVMHILWDNERAGVDSHFDHRVAG